MNLERMIFSLAALIALPTAIAPQAHAAPSPLGAASPLQPVWQQLHPDATSRIADCDNLLAVRLSRNEGTQRGPLPDCSTTPFSVSPPLSAFDCAGLTANACAALYRDDLPQYLSGGWTTDNELWALPLRDDVAGGNQCVDGTRQLAYVDRAIAWQCSTNGNACTSDADCGAGICAKHDVPSNDWVFYTQGGVNCESTQDCLDKYLEGSPTMTTLNAPFSQNGGGILSDDPRNPFHRYNRVRLKKCNKDAFVGNVTRPASGEEPRPEGTVGALTYEYDLYFHGARAWLAAFETLRSGYDRHIEFEGACLSDSDCAAGGQCVDRFNGASVNMCRYEKPLPPLANAGNIVLVGWSGGSMALAHTGDWLDEYLAGVDAPVAPNATVHLAYDAPWKPALDSDTAFWLGGRNMYLVPDHQIPTAASPGQLPPDEDATIENGADALFSKDTFLAGGALRDTYELWGAVQDASCLAMHGGDDWHCFERNHVLANHVTAPAFTRMAQRDGSGTDSPGSRHLHSMEACKAAPTEMNCYDWVDEDFRQRAFQQSVDFFRDFDTLSEEGPGAPNRGVFATDNTRHNGLEEPEQFMDVELMQCREDGAELRRTTLAETLTAWVDTGSRIGAIEWREGSALGQGYLWVSPERCSRCPLVDAASTFVRDDELDEWDLAVCQ